MPLLQPKLGQVFLLDKSFLNEGETIRDHGQLPQFLPRTEWPSEADAKLSQQNTAAFTTNINLELQEPVDRLQQSVQEVYPELPPMQPYYKDDGLYDNFDWDTHVAFVHNILHRSMQSDSSLDFEEMRALVRMVSYGMFQSMTHLYPWHVPFSEERGEVFHEEWSPTFRMYLKCGRFPSDIENKTLIKQRIWTRRWLVVPIRYGPTQWGMTIFDREESQLYIFDCGDEASRDDRIEAAIEYWVQFWNELQMPHTFQYFVPAVSRQPSAKDSGLLAIIWLMNMMRDQVGEQMDSADENIQRENMAICRPHVAPVDFESSLHMRDWMPIACRTPNTALLGVRRIIKAMLCNELGLKCHDVLTKQYNNYPGREPHIIPSAIAQIDKVVRELNDNHDTLEKWTFWTNHGGPQFVMPQRIAIRRWDPSESRRFQPENFQHRYHLETEPYALSQPTSRQVRWMSNGFSFTPDNPVSRPPHGVNLQVSGIRHAAHHDTARTQHYTVGVTNDAAPRDFRELRPLIIQFDEIQKRRRRVVGDEVIRFNLLVAVDGATPHSQVVKITIPEGYAVDDSLSPVENDSAVEVTD